MSDTVLNPTQILTLIYRNGYDLVRRHSRHRGDPEIIRAVTDAWVGWVRSYRNRATWADLSSCWNDFAATKYVRYTAAPCRTCRGHSSFSPTSCPRCWGRRPQTEVILLDRKRT